MADRLRVSIVEVVPERLLDPEVLAELGEAADAAADGDEVVLPVETLRALLVHVQVLGDRYVEHARGLFCRVCARARPPRQVRGQYWFAEDLCAGCALALQEEENALLDLLQRFTITAEGRAARGEDEG